MPLTRHLGGFLFRWQPHAQAGPCLGDGCHARELSGARCGKGDGDVEAAFLTGAGGNRGVVGVGDGADDREAEPVAAGAPGPFGPRPLLGDGWRPAA